MPGRCSQGVGPALSIVQEPLLAGVEPHPRCSLKKDSVWSY